MFFLGGREGVKYIVFVTMALDPNIVATKTLKSTIQSKNGATNRTLFFKVKFTIFLKPRPKKLVWLYTKP